MKALLCMHTEVLKHCREQPQSLSERQPHCAAVALRTVPRVERSAFHRSADKTFFNRAAQGLSGPLSSLDNLLDGHMMSLLSLDLSSNGFAGQPKPEACLSMLITGCLRVAEPAAAGLQCSLSRNPTPMYRGSTHVKIRVYAVPGAPLKGGCALAGELEGAWATAYHMQELHLANQMANLTGRLPAAWGAPGAFPRLQVRSGAGPDRLALQASPFLCPSLCTNTLIFCEESIIFHGQQTVMFCKHAEPFQRSSMQPRPPVNLTDMSRC